MLFGARGLRIEGFHPGKAADVLTMPSIWSENLFEKVRRTSPSRHPNDFPRHAICTENALCKLETLHIYVFLIFFRNRMNGLNPETGQDYESLSRT